MDPVVTNPAFRGLSATPPTSRKLKFSAGHAILDTGPASSSDTIYDGPDESSEVEYLPLIPGGREKTSGEEAGLQSKAALALVLLSQGFSKLNVKGNFSSDAFNSLIDETTGLLTMFTVYSKFEDTTIYYAAVCIYAVNAFIRFILGIHTVFRPAFGTQKSQSKDGAIFCGTWLRLIVGMVLIMLEPVSGIRLLNSAFEAAPPLTEEQMKHMLAVRKQATNQQVDAEAKIKEAEEKAAATRSDVAATDGVEDEASQAVVRLIKEMADNTTQEVVVVQMEAEYLKQNAKIVKRETDIKLLQVQIDMRARAFSLEQKKLKGTEMVELVMAVFEDIPELAVAATFAAKGGLSGATESDVSLFITSQIISVFHAAKCFWSFWTLRKVIRDSKSAKEAALDTHLDYIVVRPMIDHGINGPAGEQLTADKDALEPMKINVEEARRLWDAEFKRIDTAAASLAGGESLVKAIEIRKNAEKERQANIEAEKQRRQWCPYTSKHGSCSDRVTTLPGGTVMDFCKSHLCVKCHGKKQSTLTFCVECGGVEDEAWGRVQAESAEECAYKSRNGHCNSAHLPNSRFCRHHTCPTCSNQKSSRSARCGHCD